MRPKIFLDASHYLQDGVTSRNHDRHGICDALNAMCYWKDITESDFNAAIELLDEYFKPYERVLYWWHGSPQKDLEMTQKTQEERFIALCFLYEIAKDMQNGS